MKQTLGYLLLFSPLIAIMIFISIAVKWWIIPLALVIAICFFAFIALACRLIESDE